MEIGDWTGKRAIVTGASSGLGKIVAGELARAGATVIGTARDAARVTIPGVQGESLDLASLASVTTFADRFAHETFDLVVCNAGVMHTPPKWTDDGFELQLATNALGHFALVGRLLPALLRAPAPRVVHVSSVLASQGAVDLDDLQLRKGKYDTQRAYGNSKLAAQLYTLELDRRAKAARSPLTAYCAHPGYSATNLQTRDRKPHTWLMYKVANTLVAQSAEKGARPLLIAATTSEPSPAYYGPTGPGQMRGKPGKIDFLSRAQDEEHQRGLWEASEQLTGVSYDALALPSHPPRRDSSVGRAHD